MSFLYHPRIVVLSIEFQKHFRGEFIAIMSRKALTSHPSIWHSSEEKLS